VALWASSDLVGLGMLADEVRRRQFGAVTTYLRVATVTVEQAATAVIPPAAGEVRVHGTPAQAASRIDAIRGLVERTPRVPVTFGRLEDFDALGEDECRGLGKELRTAGVHGIASAAVDRLPDPALAVRRVMEAGLVVCRLTVDLPYPAAPWDVLERVRGVQEQTGSVRTFAPLPRTQDPAQPTTGYADMKAVALARLALDPITSIQVDWTLHGPKLAQVALLFGADDVDDVSPGDEGPSGRRRSPLEEIRRNIMAASQRPAERDGRFLPLEAA
jgi:aminodeoxyfutalosine synthase